MHLVLLKPVLLMIGAQTGKVLYLCFPVVISQLQKVLTSTHKINQRPVKKRLEEIIGTTAAPLIFPYKLIVISREMIEERINRLIHSL